ncbi:MAG: hypothetical protein JWO08_4173 [Verrucomicrobiaceae bacterium]|nr:hypothetical protein [Verrucomicrobiaceae bacterium]
MRSRAHHSRRARGFSLIEVVIGMTILAMITASLFGIIKSSVKGASDVEKLQRENDQVNRFVEQCRITLETMPASATLSLSVMDQGTGMQELKVAGVPACFPFGANPISYEDTSIGLRPDLVKPTSEGDTPMPRYTLGVTRKDIIPQTSDTTVAVQQASLGPDAADDQGRYWMPLLPGVVQLQWEFYKESTKEWVQEWSTAQWPELIKMHLTMDGRTHPLTMTFAPPELKLRAATQKAPAAPVDTKNANNNNNNGGNGRGGKGGNDKGGKGNPPPQPKGGKGGGTPPPKPS